VAVASPANRQARFLQGVALVELGRYREAAGLYAGLAGEEPTAAVLNNHAVALLRAGTGAGVQPSDELRRAVEMAPGHWELPFNLGWALLAEGDAEAATFWLRGVVQQQPKELQPRVALAWALRRSGHGDEADEEWKQVLAKAPSFEALQAPDLGRRFERLLSSERLIAPDPEDRSDAELGAVHLGRAAKLEEGGDQEAALRELMQAVYLDPYGARGHLLLARAYRSAGEGEKAVSELRVSLWCREDPGVRLELASLLRERGLGTEARAEAQRVLKAEPANAAAREFLEKP
jgi:tetratricopeptide (TPR) repeat protein